MNEEKTEKAPGHGEALPEVGGSVDCVSTIGIRNAVGEAIGLIDQLKTQQAALAAQKQETDKALQEVKMLKRQLAEVDTALKVLLDKRGDALNVLEERVVCNVNEMVRPYLQKIAAGPLNQRQRALLDAIARGLDDILSPLSRRFIIESSRLSPMEIKVAGMIRQGRTTKEIAALLDVAVSTVDFHRLNIRKKLNLKNRRVNLQAYLKSLS